MAISMLVSMTLATIIAMAAAMVPLALIIIIAVRLIMGHIRFIVPTVLHEVDGPAAGIVLGAMLAPFFRMSGRHVEIQRLLDNVSGAGVDHNRLGID